MRDRIVFYLNGARKEVQVAHAGMMLGDYLRYEEALTGTKIVCAEGDCGACTVLRLFPLAQASGKPIFIPVNSCVTTVAQMDGSSLITVDALHRESGMSPVQKAMLECHGSQCGFCTPGFVMALSGLVEKRVCSKSTGAKLGSQEVKNALTGNLCRCTGYQPIVDAATSINLSKCGSLAERFYSKTQEKELKKVLSQAIRMENENFSFFAPRTLKEAAQYLKKNPDARIIAGGTDLGVVHNKRKIRLHKLMSLHLIAELYTIKKKKTASKNQLTVGARVSLTELRNALRDSAPEIARFLDIFASPQIKNTATLVGNVGNASPIADTPPFLLVCGAVLTLVGPQGKRHVPIDKFYKGYRKTALKSGEAITEITFEIPSKTESLTLFKVSQRKDLDISTVNAAFRAQWADAEKRKLKSMQIAFGGVAAVPLRLLKTEKSLRATEISPDTIARATTVLHSEMEPISDLRGTSAFRRVLVENLFKRFFDEQCATDGSQK